MRTLRFGVASVILLATSLLLGACGTVADAKPVTLVRESAPKLGYLAPDFQLNQFKTNQPFKLSDFKGSPVLINFWQSSCDPCVQEMPDLAQAYHEHQKEGLVILGVNVREGDYRIGKYLEDKNFDWNMLLDSQGKTMDSYQVAGFPTSFFVDKQGFIQAIKLGRLEKSELDSKLALILKN